MPVQTSDDREKQIQPFLWLIPAHPQNILNYLKYLWGYFYFYITVFWVEKETLKHFLRIFGLRGKT